jgi:hypothetical protein
MGPQDRACLPRSTEIRPELIAGDRKYRKAGGFAVSRRLAHQGSTKTDAMAAGHELCPVVLNLSFLKDETEACSTAKRYGSSISLPFWPEQYRKPGEPVPEVDPEDLKEVWKTTRDNRLTGFGAAAAAQRDKSQPF